MENDGARILSNRRNDFLTYRSHVAERPLSRVGHSVRVDGVAVALRNILESKIFHEGWWWASLYVLRRADVSKVRCGGDRRVVVEIGG